ncbi:hypothetical protein CAEBREN_05284 [Caenorhabditis brenneri]|uniref:C2H2-type domain-containing protein n=1 Tax=Caenorhabditis brenneri TaxID=135651 RepID=G0MS60_CAEBE|nr:hypothetical protein CAEBREN_05284 [Caenorhabditis brenneri]
MPNEHRCSQCQKKFPNLSTLQRHQETHMITGDWMCGLCNMLCSRLSGLNQHWQNSCQEFKMVFCEDEIKKMTCDDLREAAFRLTLDHYSPEIDINEPGPSTIPTQDQKSKASLCIYCNLLLPGGTLNHHLGVHTKRHGVGERCPDLVVRYVCDLCGYGFRYKKSLFVHWRQRCSEVSANCPSQGMIVDNRQLKKIVEDLVKRGEVVKPYEIIMNSREDVKGFRNERKVEEEEEEEDEDEETKPQYTAPIISVNISDRQAWNIKNSKIELAVCGQCGRNFHSSARLKRHEDAFHENKKRAQCELCQLTFSQQRILTAHLRGACRAMKVEVPDEMRRKKLSLREIQDVVDVAKGRWRLLFEQKRTENIRFITEFLDNIERQFTQTIPKIENDVMLEVPMTVSGYIAETGSDINYCEFCKIKFNSPRFLFQHHQLVHSNQQQPRNQLTITASSLLPYFKLPEATFYDITGKEYRIGRFIEKGRDFVKHLKTQFVKPGSMVAKIEENDHFVVKLRGEDEQHILFNEHEFPEVCDRDGALNVLFSKNPRIFDDIPVLSREA